MDTRFKISVNSDNLILKIIHLHELTVMNTIFESRSISVMHTFIQTKNGSLQPHNDLGEYVGAAVKVKHKNNWVRGEVISTQYVNDLRTWKVKFNDDYIVEYEECERLKDILTRTKRDSLIAYIMVSTRWKSCITSFRSKREPSISRSLYGVKNDHTLSLIHI